MQLGQINVTNVGTLLLHCSSNPSIVSTSAVLDCLGQYKRSLKQWLSQHLTSVWLIVTGG